jgi:hypothetical protein
MLCPRRDEIKRYPLVIYRYLRVDLNFMRNLRETHAFRPAKGAGAYDLRTPAGRAELLQFRPGALHDGNESACQFVNPIMVPALNSFGWDQLSPNAKCDRSRTDEPAGGRLIHTAGRDEWYMRERGLQCLDVAWPAD